MTSEIRVRQSAEHQLVAELQGFLAGRRNLAELEKALRGRVTFERPGGIGVVHIHGPLPTVPLRREHVFGILGRVLNGVLSHAEATNWAATVLVLNCFALEHPGSDAGGLSETVWDLASDGSHDGLTPVRIRELIDRVLDAAA
jgi:hypothetical protein